MFHKIIVSSNLNLHETKCCCQISFNKIFLSKRWVEPFRHKKHCNKIKLSIEDFSVNMNKSTQICSYLRKISSKEDLLIRAKFMKLKACVYPCQATMMEHFCKKKIAKKSRSQMFDRVLNKFLSLPVVI